MTFNTLDNSAYWEGEKAWVWDGWLWKDNSQLVITNPGRKWKLDV